jgi:hypothetical protein
MKDRNIMETKSKLQNNNIEEIDNNLIDEVFSESLNIPNDIKNISEFESLSLSDKEKLFKQLDEFKQKLLLNNLDDNSQILKMIKESTSNFNSKNQKILDIWENLRNKDKTLSSQSNELINYKEASKIVNENKEIILDEMTKTKPLGELGDITVNEALNKGIEFVKPLIELGKDSNINAENSFKLLSAFFLYKGVVNLYSKTAFKDDTLNLSESSLKYRNKFKERKIRQFMYLGAPLIVGLFLIGKEITQPISVNINVNLDSKTIDSNSNTSNKYVTSSLLFITNKKLPDWLKTLIFILVVILFIYKLPYLLGITEVKNVNLFTNLIYVKWFLILGILGSIFVLIENILSLFLFIMFSKYNWKKPIHLPIFILNLIDPLYEISKESNKGYFISLFLKEILLYLFILCLCIFMFWII